MLESFRSNSKSTQSKNITIHCLTHVKRKAALQNLHLLLSNKTQSHHFAAYLVRCNCFEWAAIFPFCTPQPARRNSPLYGPLSHLPPPARQIQGVRKLWTKNICLSLIKYEFQWLLSLIGAHQKWFILWYILLSQQVWGTISKYFPRVLVWDVGPGVSVPGG